MNLSKNKIKYIQSLKDKKNRLKDKTFIAEGHKTVLDLLNTTKCQLLLGTREFLETNKYAAEEIIQVTEEELSLISFQKTPQQVLAVFYQSNCVLDESTLANKLTIALDGVQDPGNLGTIIRLADWYGIETIICSSDCADIYNPKTVQASMGALGRVKIYYTDLERLLKQNLQLPIYGTFLDGENIYNENLSESGIIVMGNEGRGIRDELKHLINKRLFLPNYPNGRVTSESLNVAIATAIVCAEFRRKSYK